MLPRHQDSIDTRLGFLDRRFSVKEFGAAPLPAHTYRELCRQVALPPKPLPTPSPPLTLYAIPGRIDALTEPHIEYTELGTGIWRSVRPVDSAQVVEQWVAASQNQALLRKAACLFCVGVAEEELSANPFELYRHAVIGAGFVVGAMYHTAMRLRVGTTTIGGFSDRSWTALLGTAGFLPIVVQAFGATGAGVRKVDAARLVLGRIK
jgi:hypothetical protein